MEIARGAPNLEAMIAQAEQFEAEAVPPALTSEEKKRIRNRTHPKAWARKKREQVIAILGAQCWVCGSTNNLHIDHEGGSRTWEMRKFSQWMRISRIIRELKEGVKIRLLCDSCNSKDASLRKHHGRSLQSSPLFTLYNIDLSQLA